MDMETGKIKKQWAISANRILQLAEEKQGRLQKEAEGQNRKWLIRELDYDIETLVSFYNETEEIVEKLLSEKHEQRAFWNIENKMRSYFEAMYIRLIDDTLDFCWETLMQTKSMDESEFKPKVLGEIESLKDKILDKYSKPNVLGNIA